MSESKENDFEEDYDFVDAKSNNNFDEIDEFMEELRLEKDQEKSHELKSCDSSLFEEEAERASPVQPLETAGKSKFYFQNIPSISNLPSLNDPEIDSIPNLEEKFIAELKSVSCHYSENSCLSSSYMLKDPRNKSVCLDGRLVLTNFRLVFVPYTEQLIDLNKVYNMDKRLLLIKHKLSQAFSIPLVSICELKASTTSSDKFKKLKNILESKSDLVIRDIIIKCKNFMTKCFSLNDKNYDTILTALSNMSSHVIIQNRFKHIISKLDAKKSQKNTRISYFNPDDLQQELVECNVIDYFRINVGCTLKSDNKFWIDL